MEQIQFFLLASAAGAAFVLALWLLSKRATRLWQKRSQRAEQQQTAEALLREMGIAHQPRRSNMSQTAQKSKWSKYLEDDGQLEGLPTIDDVPAFFGKLSPEVRKKLGLPLGAELQKGAADLAAQEMEGIGKLREKRLSRAIRHQDFKEEMVLSLDHTEKVLNVLRALQQLGEAADEDLKGPYQTAGRYIQAWGADKAYALLQQSVGEGDTQKLEMLKYILMPLSEEGGDPASRIGPDTSQPLPASHDGAKPDSAQAQTGTPPRAGAFVAPNGNGHKPK
jgi:hypothetical protein